MPPLPKNPTLPALVCSGGALVLGLLRFVLETNVLPGEWGECCSGHCHSRGVLEEGGIWSGVALVHACLGVTAVALACC